MEYYSVVKRNAAIPFAATEIRLEIIIISEISQRQTSCDITSMCNLKHDTNEPVCRTAVSQTQSADLRLPRGRALGEGRSGRLGLADVSKYIQDG